MKNKQAVNPFLSLGEYIPDGEPHVFGDRVYLFGSHDKEGGDRFCMLDYVCYSAPVDDLTDWRYEGVTYRAEQDPVYAGTGRPTTLAAPDVVQGNDGRYYLYYTTDGFKDPIKVAVCDTPAGSYEYLGVVRNPDGTPYRKRLPFDPALLNDNGTIRLYCGWALPLAPNLLNRLSMEVTGRILFGKVRDRGHSGSIMGAYTVELADDMLTVRTEPKLVAPCRMEARGTGFQDHAFYEASSIRKVGDTYYFIWSSFVNHELCYATSKYPDREFVYRGVIISNGDVGYQGRKPSQRLNTTGNNHGSIEYINGQWYVFYHRHTHNTSFSRQACAEKIKILPNGTIPQAEMTSCGLNGGPLLAEGSYPAAIACNLHRGRMGHIVNGISKADRPFITHGGEERFITGIRDGTVIGYKYFQFSGKRQLTVRTRGTAKGALDIFAAEKKIGTIAVHGGSGWIKSSATVDFTGTAALYLRYHGRGRLDFLEFGFERAENTAPGRETNGFEEEKL